MLRSVTTRVAGLIILVAGIWGGLIPFVGPYFHFTLGPDHTWVWSNARFYLDVLPAIAAVLGGLLLLGAGPWAVGRLGALLALAGGVWFAIGPDVSRLWHAGGAQGIAHGQATRRMLEYLTLHSGIGVLTTALAAFALPGVLAVRRRRLERDVALGGSAAGAGAAAEAHHRDRVGAREREPVAAGHVGEPVAAHDGQAVAARDGEAVDARGAGEPVSAPGGDAAPPPEAPTQTVTRRRGGLLSRRR